MGIWWRSRQWVYARSHVAAVGTVIILLLIGAGGWESARRVVSSSGSVADGTIDPYRRGDAQQVGLAAVPGPLIRVVEDRHATPAARPATTVVVTRRVAVPKIVARGQARTVIQERTRTIVERALAVRTVRDEHLIRETVTVPIRSTRTVTVTAVQTATLSQPVTVIQPITVTVIETVKRGKGH